MHRLFGMLLAAATVFVLGCAGAGGAPDLASVVDQGPPHPPDRAVGEPAAADAGADAPPADVASEGADGRGGLTARPSFVAALMGSHGTASWVRLAQYTFSADGSVTEEFWYWSLASFVGGAAENKVSSGYATHGCRHTCVVKTPLGFEPGARPKSLRGRHTIDGAGRLVISWEGGTTETWQATEHATVTELALISSSYGASVGWAYGSRRALSLGATIDEVKASGRLAGDYWENAYQAQTVKVQRHFSFDQYERCTASPCLQGMANTDADKTKWYHSYVSGMPTQDARKNYWNHQLGVVAQQESPGTLCISSPGAGHTAALLQIIDDDGRFLGWVGVEASLHLQAYGNAVVAAFRFTRTP